MAARKLETITSERKGGTVEKVWQRRAMKLVFRFPLGIQIKKRFFTLCVVFCHKHVCSKHVSH